MNHVLAQAFIDTVTARLDHYDHTAQHGTITALEQTARSGIPVLTAALRTLLAQHEIDSHGQCDACPRPRWRRRTPCRILHHLNLLPTDPTLLVPATGRHALRPRS
ncbi:hypothetical protein [Amycolatopsis thailandensis]|uniref:hypothetical protein n=1 Tax=Amycolatopsis thailandensis TaxID=589330 RepID=UPI00363A1D33